ncbi:hypothetical protein OG894_42045 (plasmid) [Streptomyces sp. NBC_01724]|uniref:hypothetical protein n=1 Tax=Streptomyces sp. NBC_01724 TaxID=2975922 RepID=UPI002E326807|nr:hypothetical protein [Streptomyces sp. NBC_01724]
MTRRPLTRIERQTENRHSWYLEQESKARESRGDRGAMEFWLRLTRSQIAQEIKAGRTDTWAGFALVCRLFITAMQKRAGGDRRFWDDLLKYAQDVVDANPPA